MFQVQSLHYRFPFRGAVHQYCKNGGQYPLGPIYCGPHYKSNVTSSSQPRAPAAAPASIRGTWGETGPWLEKMCDMSLFKAAVFGMQLLCSCSRGRLWSCRLRNIYNMYYKGPRIAVPTSHVTFKKAQWRLVQFRTCSCRPVEFKKCPCLLSLSF